MMGAVFPSEEWLAALDRKLNSDSHYSSVAARWEGDLLFDIRPDTRLADAVGMYLDLWHGTCRGVAFNPGPESGHRPRFILSSSYTNFAAVLRGEVNPMTAMLTNQLRVTGDLAYMMRNVPTVLDFVRCAREITTDVI